MKPMEKKKANPYNDYLVDDDDASNSTSESPSVLPSGSPSVLPSGSPSLSPSGSPSLSPSVLPSGSTSEVRQAESTPNDRATPKPKSFLPSIFGNNGGKRKTKRKINHRSAKTKKNLRGKTKKSKHKLKKHRV